MPTPSTTTADIESQHRTLAELISRITQEDGMHQTAISQLALFRTSMPSPMGHHDLCQPALCLIAQGQKVVDLDEVRFIYDPLHYLVASVALPVTSQVTVASPAEPYLSLRLNIDPAEISSLIAEAGPMAVTNSNSRGVYVDRLDTPLLDAVLRLIRLLDTPRDIAMLAPLIRREIIYRLLRSPSGQILRDITNTDSLTHRVTRAIDWLNQNYQAPLRIEDLARVANLSPSALHHRFKAVTAMSPLQYQKQLRLQEARRLMLCENLEVAAAGYRVGYESPSQFSREYSRLFGAPPLRDLARLRNAG